VSTKTKELKADGLEYRDLPLVTGDESRAAEVTGVASRSCSIQSTTCRGDRHHAVRREGARCVVRGTTADNGVVQRVLVNGQEARALRGNFAEWEVVLEGAAKGDLKVQAHAEDAAGNVENAARADGA